MAMSATISVSPSTVLINQPANAVITISNSGGSAVQVTNIAPFIFFTGSAIPYDPSANIGAINLGPSVNVSVPAAGSLSFPFSMVFFAPSTGPLGTGGGTYSVNAICQSNDGSVFSPTAATITVNPIALPSTEQ
jgi:hypothetical protein